MKDRVVGLLLFMGKIFITAAVGTWIVLLLWLPVWIRVCGHILQVSLPIWGLGLMWMVEASYGEERNSTTSLYL